MFSIEENKMLNPSWIGKALNKKCWLFDVLPKQASNENSWRTASLHSKQWFYEEQEAKFK